jgi:hypothetical protein
MTSCGKPHDKLTHLYSPALRLHTPKTAITTEGEDTWANPHRDIFSENSGQKNSSTADKMLSTRRLLHHGACANLIGACEETEKDDFSFADKVLNPSKCTGNHINRSLTATVLKLKNCPF